MVKRGEEEKENGESLRSATKGRKGYKIRIEEEENKEK